MAREGGAGYALPGHMGVCGQNGVDVISGLWTWCPFRATVVFLDPNEFCGGHCFTLPSIEIIKDDCKDLIVYDYFLDDAGRRGYEGHVVNMRRVETDRRRITHWSQATDCDSMVSQGEAVSRSPTDRFRKTPWSSGCRGCPPERCTGRVRKW